MDMTVTVDEAKLEELMGQLVGHMTGSALCFGIWLGDELGLYRALAELGASTADDLTRGWCANGSMAKLPAGSCSGTRRPTGMPSDRKRPWRWPTTNPRPSSRGR
jgi:hypothetical protein